MKNLCKRTIDKIYTWASYYFYVMFFKMFEPTTIDNIGKIGEDSDGNEVYAISAVAVFKMSRFIRIPVYAIASDEPRKNTWNTKFISSEEFFAYSLGAVEEEPIQKLTKMSILQ